jgi:putative nucleotidyltransferase with HDIG domain
VAASAALVCVTGRFVGAPDSRPLAFAWWIGLSAAATVVLIGLARLSRRLLPLAALMRLSLVFPDGAPSRFRIALRTGTVATLEERLAAARLGAPGRTPLEAAELLLALVAHLDEHDPLTRGHSERVRAYSQNVGRELRLGRRDLDLLNWAALLHDVGKLEVPHEILAKEGRPTAEEWEVLRGHPTAGAALAAPLRPWLGEWSAAIDEHHERWDGTGYPRGLADEGISLAGRIVAVADAFDVMTSTRSYKRPGSVAQARRELARCAGTHFDPGVVRAFLAISVRQSRLTLPLTWAAHAVALVRLPATQAAGGLSAGAAAVAVGVTVGASTTVHPPTPTPVPTRASAPARAPAPARPTTARPTTARAVARPHAARAAAAGASSKPAPRVRVPRQGAPHPGRAKSAPKPSPSAEHGVMAPAPVEHGPVAVRPIASEPERVPESQPAKTTRGEPAAAPSAPAAGVPPPVVPQVPAPPPAPAPVPGPVASVAEDLTGAVATVTDDVGELTGDVAAVVDPETPLADDVPSIVADAGALGGDVTSLLVPQPPPDGTAAPAQGSLPDGTTTLLGGLGKGR